MARKQARTEFQRDVDDHLTGKINNDRGAREFILKNTARMAKEIEDRFGPDLVQVYIKGKSSLKLMKLNSLGNDKSKEQAEEDEWSDFDNQIIINPYLPRTWWYEIFNQIHCYLRDEYLPSVRDTFMVKGEPQGPDDYQAPHMERVPIGEELRRKINLHGPETELKHAQKMQSHVLLCLGNEYLHPLNFFDNTRTVFGKRPDKDIDFMSDDFTEANNFFPPSVVVLKGENGKKVKSDSSIWINCTISKFLLYRLIVRYSSPGIDFNGEKCRDDINGETGKFRGEVIDISIPRRESEETINYWSRFKGDLHQLTDTNTYLRDLVANKKLPELERMRAIRVPGWEYQLQENVIMLHEVLTYTSGSAHKFYKRLERAWPALSAIEESSEKLKLSKLNSSLFQRIPELQKHYQFYNEAAIKSFYKQFAAILREDYHWDVLDEETKQELVVKYLPVINQQVRTHSDSIEELLNNFNVEKDGKDEKKSANYILKEAFSVKDSERFATTQEKDKRKQEAEQEIENYKELLRHLFIVHESNKAFGRKFHLDIAQIYRINTFRMGLEAFCNTGKKPKDIELLLGEEHEPYTYMGDDSPYDMDSQQKGPSIELQPLGKVSKKESSTSLVTEEEKQVGFGLKGRLSLQDVLDTSLDLEQEYIPQSPKQVLTTVDEHDEPAASCYFCGILSSSLDLAVRMKLFDVQELGLEYFFPVVNLYLKCTKGQWAKLKEAYLIDKEENRDPNQFIWEQKSLAPHKIRVIFIDIDNQKLALEHDAGIVDFDKELTTQRVNDRLGINTLSQQADQLYDCLAGMNARLIEFYKRYKNEEERDKAAIERYLPDHLRVTEIAAREKNLKTLAGKMQDIDNYLLQPLKDIYAQLCVLKRLVNKAEKKGHIRDLLLRHKVLSIAADNIVTFIDKDIVNGLDGNKENIVKRYGEFGITKQHVNDLVLAANELRRHTEALKINPRKDQALVMKALQKHADNLENNQESLIFARNNNDRGVLIEDRPFRILREPQINQYFHYYIGKSRDFYLLHWLDHKRVHYKSNITNFRTQLSRWIEMPDPSKRNES